MRRENASIMIRNVKLNAEKTRRYFPALPLLCCEYSLKVIRLARDDMIVPQPPTFTPSRSS